MPGTHPERRRAPRAKASFPILMSDQKGPCEATLKDLSTSGLCCTYPQELSEMSLLQIDLDLPGGKARHRIQGAVVRCEKVPPSYEVAVFFTEVSPEARAALEAYVAAHAPAARGTA